MAPITCDTCNRSFNSKIDFYKHVTSSPLGCKILETNTNNSTNDTNSPPTTYPIFIGKRQVNNKLEWEKYKIDGTVKSNSQLLPITKLKLNTKRPITESSKQSTIDELDNSVRSKGSSETKIAHLQKTEYIKPDIRALRTANTYLSQDDIDDYIKKNTKKVITTRKTLDMVDDERPRIRSSADSGVTYQIGRTKYDTKIAYYNALSSMGKTEKTMVNMNDITKLTQMHGKLRHELTTIKQFSDTILLTQSTIIGEDYYTLDGITRHCSSTKKMVFKLTDNLEGSILVINATQVIIDLNGFEIRQADHDAIIDRFNTVVEMIDCNHCYVINGIIGSSSKNGLTLNNSNDILVNNIRFKEYEYAAINITGNSHNIGLSDLKLLGTKTNVPVNGWYDVMSQLIPKIQDINTEESNNITNIFDKMTTHLIQKKVDKLFTRMNLSLFDNPSGIVYSDTYGILIDIDPDIDMGTNIYMSDIHVNAQVNKIDEVVTAYKDINGNAFPLFETMREGLTYEENIISKSQLMLDSSLTIDDSYINDNNTYSFNRRLIFGIDHQMRVCNGNRGISIKNGHNICIERCNCSNIINRSPIGKIPSNYDITNRNYLLQLQKEYKGSNTYGLCIDACSTVFLRDIDISNIISASGAVYGIGIINNSKDVRMSRINISKLRADNKTKLVLYNNNPTSMPTEEPKHIESGSTAVNIN